MTIQKVIPLIGFMITASISPGPNNIMSATFGMRSGYKSAFKFIAGVYTGIVLMMIVVGSLIDHVTVLFPKVAIYLKFFSAVYLIYLTVTIVLMKNFSLRKSNDTDLWLKGFLLQIVNPKAYLFCLTIYSVFFGEYTGFFLKIIVISLLLPFVTVICTGIWALAGSTLRKQFENTAFLFISKIIMTTVMCYVIISIILI